ncbi:MAG: hypothetical protein U0840_20755 [Gemmataceae bacterium]
MLEAMEPEAILFRPRETASRQAMGHHLGWSPAQASEFLAVQQRRSIRSTPFALARCAEELSPRTLKQASEKGVSHDHA